MKHITAFGYISFTPNKTLSMFTNVCTRVALINILFDCVIGKKKTMKVILTVVLDIFFCLKLNYYYAHHL